MRRVSKRVNKSKRRVSKRIQKSRRKDRQERQDKNRKTKKQMKRSKINNKTNRQTGKRRNRRNKKNKKRNKKNYNNKQRGGVPLSGMGVYMLKDVTEEIKDMIDDKTKLPRQTYVYKTAEYDGEGVPSGDWLRDNGAVFYEIERCVGPYRKNDYIFIKGDGSSFPLKLKDPEVRDGYTFLRYHYALPSGALGPGQTVGGSRIIIDKLLLGAMSNEDLEEYILLAPADACSPHPASPDKRGVPRKYNNLKEMLDSSLHVGLPAAINPDELVVGDF